MRRAMIITTDFGFVRVRFVEIFVADVLCPQFLMLKPPSLLLKFVKYGGWFCESSRCRNLCC